MSEFPGILSGLACALFQALSYIGSRWFVQHTKRTPFELLILSHIIMGAVCLALLPFTIPEAGFNWERCLPPLILNTFCYLSGQFCFFMALKHAEPSRVSPVLGIKVFVLAFVSYLFFKEIFSMSQVLSVILCVASVIMLNWSGQTIPTKALAWICTACIGYSGSDLCGQVFINRVPELAKFHQAALFVICSYTLCGLVGLAILPTLKNITRKDWVNALPFSFFWLSSMFLLFYSFTFIGVVYAIIIQSSRGIQSIILGAIIAKWGFEHLESKITKGVLTKRLAAAILMIIAIILFYMGKIPKKTENSSNVEQEISDQVRSDNN